MHNLLRFGGTLSILTGAAYLASAVAFLVQPDALRGAETPDAFWTALAAGAPSHLLVHWTSAAAGVLGLGVVPAAHRLVRSDAEGWALWAAALAYLGFAVTARSHLMEVEFDLRVAPLYLGLAPETKAAVPLVAGLALDVPHGWLTFAGIGFWVLVVSLLGARSGVVARPLALLGCGLAATFLAAALGFSLRLFPLVTLGIGLGGAVLAPLWFAGFGVMLRRTAEPRS